MGDWKEIGKKLLFPPIWAVILLTVICAVALLEIFINGWEMSPFAYISYVLSFYTLTVLCIMCWKVIPGYYKDVKSKMHNNKYIHRYMTDAVFKSNVGLYGSLAINLIYVVVNAVSGYLYQTYWFAIFASIYLKSVRYISVSDGCPWPSISQILDESPCGVSEYLLISVVCPVSDPVLV